MPMTETKAFAYSSRFRNALGHYFFVAFFVACVATVFALIACRIKQKFAAKCTKNDLIELALHKFVSVHFVNFFLPLADSALTAKTARSVERSLANVLLD